MDSLIAGIYTVTVTDTTGSQQMDSIMMTQPDSIVLSFVVTNASCAGDSNGTINTTVTGGVPAFSFNWSNGDSTQNINGLDDNFYIVTITDANLCTAIGDTDVQALHATAQGVAADSQPLS